MKEPIVLIKDIRQGCYSLDPNERENSRGGFMMPAGATYKYSVDPNWANGQGFYYCGTHIIMERNIDWNIFIKQSQYHELMDRVKKELEKELEK